MDQNFLYWQYHQKTSTCGFLCLYLQFSYSFLICIINIKLASIRYLCREMVINVFDLHDILPDNRKYQQLSIVKWQLIKWQVKHRNFVFYKLLSIKFLQFVFVSSMILSHVIAESSAVLAKYFPFLQLHVAGFQI